MLRQLTKSVAVAAVAGSGGFVVQKSGLVDVKSTGIFRFGRAALFITGIGWDYKKTLKGLDTESEEYVVIKSKLHLRSAEKLRELCCLNGGCFIKVGQHLGALDYLLPPEYVSTLKVLHSDAPQTPVNRLQKVIKEDLGKDVDELFTSFENEPLGAASLAQVHKATLKDGRVVAVKIQHPDVQSHAAIDMKCMEILVKAVAWAFPEFQFMWLAEETKKNLPKELDFLHEGRNCEKMGKMFSRFTFLKVPKIYWDLSTKRILTMEFCEGGKVNDREYMDRHGISVNEVSSKLGKLYSEMIFVKGYIHCDPHPGNVLVHKTNQGTKLVLLDHGLYQTLTDEFRISYCHLWTSIINADVNGIKHYADKMGCGHVFGLFACVLTARSWEAVSAGVNKTNFTEAEGDEIKSEASRYLPEIADILNSVPREMLLILKTNDLLRGIESVLRTRASSSSFITMAKCCTRAVANYDQMLCNSWTSRFRISVRLQWSLLKIQIYELFLYARTLISRKNTLL
ncbi:aarF domain-containing protein kinase 1-like [Lineus longissimus]|uniref:aarF domain-containing protein kinase 1-like n=1 Tax=Lineus longissimus TaxID=88925 RepID=UPI002B4CB080